MPDPDSAPDVPYSTAVGLDHRGLRPALASVVGPPAQAPTIARRVRQTATALGLDDNATVAVAAMGPAA